MQDQSKVDTLLKIYVDGSVLKNPGGAGGWCAILVFKHQKKVFSGGEDSTTNNRMELMGVIGGLSQIKAKVPIEVLTDSQYVRNGILWWIKRWKQNGWITAEGEPVRNRDLWEKLDSEVQKRDVKFRWLRGHSGDEFNEEADRIAKEEAVRRKSSDEIRVYA